MNIQASHAHSQDTFDDPACLNAPVSGNRSRANTGLSIRTINEAVQQASSWVAPLKQEAGRVIVGQDHLIERLLMSLLSGGHILLEGMPGLAKTLALKTIADIIKTDFRRIQFTPDMLPADIIGTEIYNPRDVNFVIKKGPVFSNLILADEINRAPAKVQSALLEAMQERQVTIGDTTYALPSPFLVMATQNPVEQEGTYPLPEAQIDRFMMKVVVTYPSVTEERIILDTTDTTDRPKQVNPVVEKAEIIRAQQVAATIYMDDKIRDYIVAIVYATREPENYDLDLRHYIACGASPRATINLKAAGKALAFLNGRAYVTPEDIKSAAMDVLRHRISLTYEAEAAGVTGEAIVERILDTVPVP